MNRVLNCICDAGQGKKSMLTHDSFPYSFSEPGLDWNVQVLLILEKIEEINHE